MFDNVGGKIKGFAKVVCWIGIIGSTIGGIGCFVASSGVRYSMQTTLILSGFAVITVGSLLSWLGSLFTYGFGELIEQTTAINAKLQHNGTGNSSAPSVSSAPSAIVTPLPGSVTSRVDRLRRMLDQGLITEDEYNQALSK